MRRAGATAAPVFSAADSQPPNPAEAARSSIRVVRLSFSSPGAMASRMHRTVSSSERRADQGRRTGKGAVPSGSCARAVHRRAISVSRLLLPAPGAPWNSCDTPGASSPSLHERPAAANRSQRLRADPFDRGDLALAPDEKLRRMPVAAPRERPQAFRQDAFVIGGRSVHRPSLALPSIAPGDGRKDCTNVKVARDPAYGPTQRHPVYRNNFNTLDRAGLSWTELCHKIPSASIKKGV